MPTRGWDIRITSGTMECRGPFFLDSSNHLQSRAGYRDHHARQRRPGDHRGHAARAFGVGGHLDRHRLAPRDSRAERHLALHRAHAVQGDHAPLGRGHRALGGFDRRQPGRLHRQRTGLLQHQGARPAPVAGLRRAGRPGAQPAVPRRKTSRRKRASSWKRSRWRRTAPTTWSTRSSPPISGRTTRSASPSWARAKPSKRFDTRHDPRLLLARSTRPPTCWSPRPAI